MQVEDARYPRSLQKHVMQALPGHHRLKWTVMQLARLMAAPARGCAPESRAMAVCQTQDDLAEAQ